MKNSHVIIKSSLTYIGNIILTKKIHLLNFFSLKRMVIEMLLNNDIQIFFCSNEF